MIAQTIPAPPMDYSAIMPQLVLTVTAVLVILMICVRRVDPGWNALVAAVGTVVAGFYAWKLWIQVVTDGEPRFAFAGMVAADGFSTFLVFLVCVAALLGILLADQYFRREGIDKGEYYAMLLLSATGMAFMATANNLLMIFVGLELLSICLYVLVAWRRDSMRSQEAGAKYLLLGAYSSAIMLFGIALLYGGTGTTNLARMAELFSQNILSAPGTVLLGMVFVIVGLGFKVAAVPFHMWTPDVYQGAPGPVVAFMASGAKIAGFAGLWRVLATGLAVFKLDWQPLLLALAVVTMLGGSVLAIAQKDVKRMLAYSSIAHAGFILSGLVAGNAEGTKGALFYLAAYVFMTAGAFGIVALIARKGERYTRLDDYRNLFRREPMLATLMAFFLFAMAGIPGTSGFVAKFAVFTGLAAADQWVLLVVATLSSVVSAFFYLRVVVYMYMQPTEPGMGELTDGSAFPRVRVAPASVLALVITTFFTIQLGILPQGLLNLAGQARLIF